MDSMEEREKRFLEFEVEEEPWNIYDLRDGTRLKTKFILVTVLQEPASKGFSLGFTSKVVVGAMPPQELMGKPSEPSTGKELESSVVEEDIEFTTVREGWNRYKLENGIVLKIKNVLVQVSRTNRYDSKGVPIYIVNSGAIVKMKVPKASE